MDQSSQGTDEFSYESIVVLGTNLDEKNQCLARVRTRHLRSHLPFMNEILTRLTDLVGVTKKFIIERL